MKKQIVTSFGRYQEACEELAKEFMYTYYPGKDIEWHWIHDRVGGTLRVNLNCLEMKEIFDTMRLNPTVAQFHDYAGLKLQFDDDGKECDRTLGMFLRYGEAKIGKIPLLDYDL